MRRNSSFLPRPVPALAVLVCASQPVRACWPCRAQVHAQVYSEGFIPQLVLLSLPVLVMLAVGAGLQMGARVVAGRSAPGANR